MTLFGDGKQDLLRPSGEAMPDPTPPGILDSIAACCKANLQNLLDIPFNRLDKIELAMRTGKPTCLSSSGNSYACEAAIYGSLILGLRKCGLYPRQCTDRQGYSVTGVAFMLSCLELHRFKDEHDLCATGLAAEVTNALWTMKDPVLDCHRVHMQVQRGETVEKGAEKSTLISGSGGGPSAQ
ncbi:hypothetical protein B0J14DRAFT_178510 [Halenospora varia]|nr:hypothetical protein B0J14DRAFT_178510 [Halenospora varia]